MYSVYTFVDLLPYNRLLRSLSLSGHTRMYIATIVTRRINACIAITGLSPISFVIISLRFGARRKCRV